MSSVSRLPQGSRPLTPMLVPRVSARRPNEGRKRASARAGTTEWPRVLGEALFRDALLRERRRVDRFEQAFVLVLISLDRRTRSATRWRRLVDCLSQTAIETDLVGWLEHGAVLGIIRLLDDRSAS